jgi:hypothetical protein
MKNYLFLIITSSCIAASCKKDPTANAVLPPATQEGKNTVAFTINGEVWVPYYKCRYFISPCHEISAKYGALGGTAPNGIDFGFTRERRGKFSSLSVSSTGLGTITTIGNKIDSIGISFSDENSSGNDGQYGGPLPGSKFIITKIDHQNEIISGEFELIFIEQNRSGKTLTLKDGRFDFKFNACKCSN